MSGLEKAEPSGKSSSASPARLGILLSGRGSNFLALHEAICSEQVDAQIALVLSNRPRAPGLQKARDLGLPTLAISHRGKEREEHDRLVVEALREAGVDWVCLAGYMRLLTSVFVRAFPHRALNIHPSLLPAFPGLDAQVQALEHGVRVSGCTVHLVDEGLDSGPIVVQRPVLVADDETQESLAAKILDEEHRAYPEALSRLLAQPWTVQGRRVLFGKHRS